MIEVAALESVLGWELAVAGLELELELRPSPGFRWPLRLELVQGCWVGC